MFSYEKNKNFDPSRFSSTFIAIIQTQELREIHMSGGVFTWSNNQKDSTLEKLDRILMSRCWESLFPIAHVHKPPRGISDHCPLVLDTSVMQGKKTRSFHFELSWLKDPKVIRRIQEIWEVPLRDECMLNRVRFKLKKLRNFLKGWGNNKAGQNKKRKNKL
jgi:hypothetical protein